jgi:WD40 repeat protein
VIEKIIHTNSSTYVVAISADGNRIVSGSYDNTIRIWDAHTGEALGVPLQGHTRSVSSVAISPDGNHIVSGSNDNTIRIWDAHTGEALGVPLQGHTSMVLSVAISGDGNRIVSGSRDNTIRIWDAHTGEALGVPLQGHTSMVLSVAISGDGNRIVSGSKDNTIRIWDAHTGEALGVPLQGHTTSVESVAISVDGNRIVSRSESDRTIRVSSVGSYLNSPAICFSPNPTHTLCSTSESSFLENSDRMLAAGTSLSSVEGWIVGPEGRLLLWIPIALYPVRYGPLAGNTLVIPNDALQIDLSYFAHGLSWNECEYCLETASC